MGRYYSGDIEGKFWFGVQSSTAAERFGVEGCQPASLTYSFDEDNLPAVRDEISSIEETIGADNIKRLDEFFSGDGGYNDKMLEEAGLLEIWNKHKEDYADLYLGKKIETCLVENGTCTFDAEL